MFEKCEGVDVEMPTFDVYPDDESFIMHFNFISQYNDLEANSQGNIEHFDLLLYIDGYIKKRQIEDPFDEVFSYQCHKTFIQDLIMHHWADWM